MVQKPSFELQGRDQFSAACVEVVADEVHALCAFDAAF